MINDNFKFDLDFHEPYSFLIKYSRLVEGLKAGRLKTNDKIIELNRIDEYPETPRTFGYVLTFSGIWAPTLDSEALALPDLVYEGYYHAPIPGRFKFAIHGGDPTVEVLEHFQAARPSS